MELKDVGRYLIEGIYKKDFATVCDENPDLINTPERFAKAITEWFTPTPFEFTTFDGEGYGLVAVSDIDFHSFCEHHLAAIIGKVSIKYIPNKKIAGLSKFPRTVRFFSKKPMIQERFNKEVFDFLWDKLEPKYLRVDVDALHTCMTTRGANSVNSSTKTYIEKGEQQ